MSIKILGGTANPALSRDIARHLGIPLVACEIRRFGDGEIFVEVCENLRGEDVFVIQPTSSPANDTLMELLIVIDTLRRSSARRVTAVIPYYGYARQDRKTGPRTPISAKLTANLIEAAGASRVLTMDLHAAQIQGFFDIPTDNLFAAPVFVHDIQGRATRQGLNPLVVSPDVGGLVRARLLAKRLNCGLAVIDKRRDEKGQPSVMHVIGEVAGFDCLLVDDIVDTAGTLCQATDALLTRAARSVSAVVSHGVLSGEARRRIEDSSLDEVVITDSIENEARGKVRVASVALLFAEAVRSIGEEKSISKLFL